MMDSSKQSFENNDAHGSEAVDEGAVLPRRLRFRLLWIAGIVAVILLLLLTPPLLNVSRLRRRIAASMSASLGRPVHLDGVTLQLLPIPGFTLQNLVVSEDPAFGSEPVIRANKVVVTLRASSLWRRQIEISSVRFQVDEFGSGPTLNLVRNERGEWNLQSLLMHAAEVDTAPTEQRAAGPAPRFPYVEATNGRINVKLGEEKQPFSLTEADFALWLPSAEQWRVRLVGKAARTDTNVADTGTIRVEGQLQRAARMDAVPVDLRMSWHEAPLGEASKLLTGSDAGWRGTLNVDASLQGPLSKAKMIANFHVNDLRRADFVPAKLLNPNVECNGSFDVTNAVVTDPSCTLPTPVPAGGKAAGVKAAGGVVAIADALALQDVHGAQFGVTGLRLGMTNVADSYLMDWARLFSQRIPASVAPEGVAAGSMVYQASTDAKTPGAWQGEFHSEVAETLPWKPAADAVGGSHPVQTISFAASQSGITLAPLNLTTAKSAPLVLTGEATPEGYTLRLAGTATVGQLQSVRATLPPLGDGLQVVVPEVGDAKAPAEKAVKVNVTCSRPWGGLQSCAVASVAAKPRRGRRR